MRAGTDGLTWVIGQQSRSPAPPTADVQISSTTERRAVKLSDPDFAAPADGVAAALAMAAVAAVVQGRAAAALVAGAAAAVT